MICKKCNREIEENTRFCPFCGEVQDADCPAEAIENVENELPNAEEDLDAYLPVDNAPAPEGGPQKKSVKKKVVTLIILLSVLTVVPVLIIVAVIVGGIVLSAGGGFAALFSGLTEKDRIEAVVPDETVEHGHDGDGTPDHSADDHDDFYFSGTPETEESEDDDDYYSYYDESTAADTYFEEETVPEETDPVSKYDENQRVVVADGGLNIRNAPSLSGSVVGLIPNGTIITVERIQDNWAYTGVGGVYGWCSCDYLFVPYEYSAPPIYRATVTSHSGVQIESDQYVDDDVLHTLVPYGDELLVYEIDGNRAFVSYNNIYGWCFTYDLDLYYEY